MRLVLDTNTVVSGLIWGGVRGQLIDAAAAGTVQIISILEKGTQLFGAAEPEVRKRAKARMASPAYSGATARLAGSWPTDRLGRAHAGPLATGQSFRDG